MANTTNATTDEIEPKDKTADTEKIVPEQTGPEKTILVAYVTVHLVNEESFQLLPFQHAEDVKSEVNKLTESWAQSGFLVRGSRLYPWHQVRLIEVKSVEELPASRAAQSLIDWQIEDQYRVLDSFWKTKKPQGKGDKNQGDGKETKAAGGEAAQK